MRYHYIIQTAKATSIHNTIASSYNMTKSLWNADNEEKGGNNTEKLIEVSYVSKTFVMSSTLPFWIMLTNWLLIKINIFSSLYYNK
jgi:hypothetical protein